MGRVLLCSVLRPQAQVPVRMAGGGGSGVSAVGSMANLEG